MMRRLSLLLTLGCLAGCPTAPLHSADQPARVVNPDEASRQELEQVVSTALHGADVTLAPDVLTRSNTLTVERQPRQRIDQVPLDGRNPGEPERFRLVLDGTQCTLVHDNTGMRWLLLDTACAAE